MFKETEKEATSVTTMYSYTSKYMIVYTGVLTSTLRSMYFVRSRFIYLESDSNTRTLYHTSKYYMYGDSCSRFLGWVGL